MPDISAYVLKPFPYSRNGIRVDYAEASTTIDLPGRLFDGLNVEGYVRRAVIGDGHFALTSSVAASEDASESSLVTHDLGFTIPLSETVHVNNGPARVVAPAPQPPAATADLTEEELAALADGSWKEWRFFKQRSVAAKISDQPVKDGAMAKAVIEAYIASKG